MKKIIALTLVLILAVGLFAGCKSSDKGSVYFLNFKPEADSAWQALAKTYTEKTGVTVKVVTAASGTYETTLTAEMAKKDAPTLFQCDNETALDTWKDYCLALDGTEFLNEMTTSDFNIKGEDGKTYFFRRWTDWTDFSESPVESSEDTEAETKTQYRYKSKEA